MDQAWVVAVDMGYGHQRAACPFRDVAYEGIITANTGSMVDAAERKRWTTLQSLYEGVSRINKVPVIVRGSGALTIAFRPSVRITHLARCRSRRSDRCG
jgi:hypothetical protein